MMTIGDFECLLYSRPCAKLFVSIISFDQQPSEVDMVISFHREEMEGLWLVT